MDKLNICVLFTGQFRNSDGFAKQFIDWIKQQNNVGYVDSYVHCWWDKSYVGKYYSTKNLRKVEDDPTKQIIEELNPKMLLLEPQAKINFDGLPCISFPGTSAYQRETTFFSVLSQFESLKRCADLVDLNKYDLVIKARFDLIMTQPKISWGITKEMLKEDYVFIADGKFFTGWPLGDHIIAGNPNIMSRICNNYGKLFINVYREIGQPMELHTYLSHIIDRIDGKIVPWHIWIKLGMATFGIPTHERNHVPYWYEFLNQDRLQS